MFSSWFFFFLLSFVLIVFLIFIFICPLFLHDLHFSLLIFIFLDFIFFLIFIFLLDLFSWLSCFLPDSFSSYFHLSSFSSWFTFFSPDFFSSSVSSWFSFFSPEFHFSWFYLLPNFHFSPGFVLLIFFYSPVFFLVLFLLTLFVLIFFLIFIFVSEFYLSLVSSWFLFFSPDFHFSWVNFFLVCIFLLDLFSWFSFFYLSCFILDSLSPYFHLSPFSSWFSFIFSWFISFSPDLHFSLFYLLSDFHFCPGFFSLLIFIFFSWFLFVLGFFLIFIFLSWSLFVSPDCLSLSAETFPCCCHHRQSELRRLTLSCHILICFKQWPPKNHLSIHFLKSSSFLARFNSLSLVWVAASLRKATLRPHRWHDCSERLLTD